MIYHSYQKKDINIVVVYTPKEYVIKKNMGA